MATIQFRPAMIKTPFVRDLDSMMETLALLDGDGCMAGICGEPGRGKTFSVQAKASQINGVYMRAQYIWRGSEREFVQGLCRALDMPQVPGTKGACYLAAVDRLANSNRPVFIDEMQRLPKGFLNIALDLADSTGCHVILVGEPELKGMMQENKRVWSRTYQFLEPQPITIQEVLLYALETSGLKLPMPAATVLLQKSGGDFRLVKRAMVALVQHIRARGNGDTVTEEMARIAADAGLKGKA